jgi:hypothetical protein
MQANTSSNKTQNKDHCHKSKPRKSTGEKKQSTEEDIVYEEFEMRFFFMRFLKEFLNDIGGFDQGNKGREVIGNSEA